MREYDLEVLEKYSQEVNSTRRMRGAFFCDTNEGTMLLKETKVSVKRAPLLYFVLSRLEEQGELADTPVFAANGELVVTSRDGRHYMLKKWHEGRECDMKRESEVMAAARRLAILHRKFQWNEPDQQELERFAENQEQWQEEDRENSPQNDSNGKSEDLKEISQSNVLQPESREQELHRIAKIRPPVMRSPIEELLRHNREMKKVRSFIRRQVAKNEFEYLYLAYFEKMYSLACDALNAMEQSDCMQLYQQSVREQKLLHGDYNYHNVLVLSDGMAITNFEHLKIGIQVQDLYYFLRKSLEKCHWRKEVGQNILNAYESVRMLEPAEREYLHFRLAYPEKFWKTASMYSRSNKAWLPEKSVEKLKLAVRQTEEKTEFLRRVFQEY